MTHPGHLQFGEKGIEPWVSRLPTAVARQGKGVRCPTPLDEVARELKCSLIVEGFSFDTREDITIG
jgi:hypothetical protein